LLAVSQQRYETDILRESVILGNEALFKCSIPSFVADFVSVVSWEDSENNSWQSGRLFGNFSRIKCRSE
jgi:hypothetical protein